MGRPDSASGGAGGGAAGSGAGGGKTLALTVNAEGDINYDAVLAQSKNAQKWLQTTHKALVPKVDELKAEVSRRPAATGCRCWLLLPAAGQLWRRPLDADNDGSAGARAAETQ